MVRLTRLNGTVTHVNADLIASIEEHHDTVVTLVDGKTYVVQETAEELVTGIVTYRGSILAAVERMATESGGVDAQLVVLHPAADPDEAPARLDRRS